MYNPDLFIADLNNKEENAWARMYREFYPALCAYAENLTQNDIGVEDLVQECMITLYESSLHFENIKALTVYLYKTVYHRALNLIRNRENNRKLLDNYRIVLSEETAIEIAIEENVVAKLRMILNSLSKQQEQIISMTLKGLKVKEIAQVLEVSENTVKMQKKRAYSIIRERMGVIWEIWLIHLFPQFF